jgi:hypothetical protein
MAEQKALSLKQIHCQQVTSSCSDAGGKAYPTAWRGCLARTSTPLRRLGDGA